MAIASDKMVFYYMARDNLCFLTLCEEAYPKRLAFLYLDEIADIILQELLREYGSNVSFSSSFVARNVEQK
jgi:vesicle transport protein SEC22